MLWQTPTFDTGEVIIQDGETLRLKDGTIDFVDKDGNVIAAAAYDVWEVRG